MGGLLKKWQVLGVVVLLVVLAAGFGGWHWWTGTPQYSMRELRTAIQEHNATAAMKYIDFDSVFDGIWSEVTTKATTELQTSNDPYATFGETLGLALMNSMKGTVEEQARAQLIASINATNTTVLAQSAAPEDGQAPAVASSTTEILSALQGNTAYTLTRDGSTATIALPNGITLRLTQTPDRYWQITGIDGLLQ